MDYYNLTISDAQKNNFFTCIDGELKRSGLSNLEALVGLYNLLQAASPIPQETKEDVNPKKDEEGTQEKLQSDG